MKCIPVVVLALLATPSYARDITFGEIQAFISMGMEIRLPDCEEDHCGRHVPASSITPDEFMKTDTIDFAGQRLRGLPEWLYEIDGLKTLRLTNSVVPWDDFWRLKELSAIEVLDLDNVEFTGVFTEFSTNADGSNDLDNILLSRSDVFKSVFSEMNSLAHLSMSNLSFTDRDSNFDGSPDDILSEGIFDDSTARRLIELNIDIPNARGELPLHTFDNLTSLIGPSSMTLHINYEDAFSLPRLEHLVGFASGSASVYVRGRMQSKRILVLTDLFETDLEGAASFIADEFGLNGLDENFNVQVEGDDITVSVPHYSIFESSSYYPAKPELRALMANIGFLMKAYPNETLVVEGHTEVSGSHEGSVANATYSLEQIKGVLFQYVEEQRVRFISYGDEFAVEDLTETSDPYLSRSFVFRFGG